MNSAIKNLTFLFCSVTLALLAFQWPTSPADSLPTQEKPGHYCFSDQVHQQLLRSQPSLQILEEQLENKRIREYHNNEIKRVSAVKILPVVVHIIHQNGPENISDAMVQQGIDHLNAAFENIGAYDPSTGTNTEIQFCLARRTPDGNATNGINRIQSSLTNMTLESEDVQVKDLSRWDPTQYINIWIVKEICSSAQGCGVAGYAYFPSAHGSNIDGAMMEARWFGTSPGNSGVIIHELGHYLGLYHTFENGCGNGNCLSDGDRVCDTPPDQSTAAVPCSATPNSCSTDVNPADPNNPFTTDQNDLFWNYMDYGDWDCYSAFTPGQKERMHFFLDGVRASLLDSKGCIDPCNNPITASFTTSSTTVNAGVSTTFINTSANATSYAWYVDGILQSTAMNFNYVFPAEGVYQITLEVSNSDPNCVDTELMIINVECPVMANFSVSSTQVKPSDNVFFTNTSTNATNYQWFIDDVFHTSTPNFDIVFGALGNYEVYLIASNGICVDTSFSSIITVTNQGLAQTGLPVWPLVTDGGAEIQAVDWQSIDPTVNTVVTTSLSALYGQTGAAFNDCGQLVFFAVHTGAPDPNQLFLYEEDGTPLLTNTTPNGPGFNSVKGGNEIQVVRVPQEIDEWYIIYNKWSSDSGALGNNAQYTPANILYSRVKKELDGSLIVLERDVTLLASGSVRTYTDGKAVSRTINGDVNGHWLYACRRSTGQSSFALDRWEIRNSGITFNKTTGTVPAPYFNLTFAGSPIELSPTENRIAVVNRNQVASQEDVYIFNAPNFDNSSYTAIKLNELTLVSDGTANDQSNVLPNSGIVNSIAGNTTLPLRFLSNLGKKFNGVEFSPNGRFIYMTAGGYVSSGYSNLSYLAQIDLESNPMALRLQIQEPPYGNYNPNTGRGCLYSSGTCLADYHAVSHIESSYDGNLYFVKRGKEQLNVIPDPNNIMPQNLVPSSIDLSTSAEPNITTNGVIAFMPDQIDGYNYLNFSSGRVDFIVNSLNCLGNCNAPYSLEVVQNNLVIENLLIEQCPDTITLCLDTAGVYDLRVPTFGITYPAAIIDLEVNYPAGQQLFDFSDNAACIEECDNQIDDDGDGLVDCDDPDLQDSCCCLQPTLMLELGPDIYMCENGVNVLTATDGFETYFWQDGFSEQAYTTYGPGKYWVQVFDGCFWQADTIEVFVDDLTVLDLGEDNSICAGDSIEVVLNGFDNYEWFPKELTDCDTCATNIFKPDSTVTITVVAGSSLGCYSVDSFQLTIKPNYSFEIDTTICDGGIFFFDGMAIPAGTTDTFSYNSPTACDSTYLVSVINGGPSWFESWDTLICQNESLIYDGVELFAGDSQIFSYSTAGGCDSSIAVSVLSKPNPSSLLDTMVCEGQSIFYNAVELFAGDSETFTYSNLDGCDSLVFVNVLPLQNSSSQKDTSICAGESIFYNSVEIFAGDSEDFNYTNAVGCDSIFTLNVLPLPHSSVAIDTATCPGETVMINNVILEPGVPLTFTFTNVWGCDSTRVYTLMELDTFFTVIDTAICAGEILMIAGLEMTADTQVAVPMSSQSGCDSTILITVFEKEVTALAIDTTLCAGLELTLEGQIYEEAGQYELDHSSTSCDTIVVLNLDFYDDVNVLFTEDFTILAEEEVHLIPVIYSNELLNYSWTPVDYLSCSDCPSPIASPPDDITYELTVTTAAGCEHSAQLSIRLDKNRAVYIPNIFSPNGDGVNDSFHVFGNENVKRIKKMSIFDRWGELIFEIQNVLPNDPTFGWDGTFRGRALNPAVFTWMVEIEYRGGEEAALSGDVTLIR